MPKWKDDIKIYLREICQGYMNCIDLAQDRGNWRNFVQTVMNFESSTKCRESVPQLRQYQLLKKGKFGSSHYFRHFLPSRKKCLLARHIHLSVCLSVCLHVSLRVQLGVFPQNSILVTFFTNICQDNLNWTQFKKSANLHDHLRRFIAAGDTNSQQRYLCALFDNFILLTATYSTTIPAKSIFAVSIARMVT